MGATTSSVHGKNVSKQAEDNGFWTTPRSTGGKSKSFGIHEIPDSQEEKEEDLDLTLNEVETTDEEWRRRPLIGRPIRNGQARYAI